MRRILSLVLACSLFAASCTKDDALLAKEPAQELTTTIHAASYNQRVTLTIDLPAAVKTLVVVVPTGQTVVRIQTDEVNACCPRIIKIERD
jgi:hypothetical protein